MFFTLSKCLAEFIYPFSLGMCLLILSSLLRKRHPRRARFLYGVAVVGLYTLSIEPVADLLLYPLESPYLNRPEPAEAKGIVVLNGMSDLLLSDEIRVELESGGDRIVTAVVLARKWPESLLIISGGSGDLFFQAKSESRILANLAMRLGIPKERIRIDPQARNTHENAVETKKILAREGISDFLLITSAVHMRRSLACFGKAGLHPTSCAVDFKGHYGMYDPFSFLPRVNDLSKSTHAVHEYVGIVTYRLKGFI